MIRIQLTCDCCRWSMHLGETGEPAHRIRKRLRAEGWRQVDIQWRVDRNGKSDLCPKCWEQHRGSKAKEAR